MVVSALLVLVGVVLSILLAFRTPRALPALALPLVIGTVWGFGVASLFVSSLGSSTAFLGSIVIGNGINPGIILLARYLEERRRGTPVASAVTVATNTTWRGTLAAAVAAAAGYASLTIPAFAASTVWRDRVVRGAHLLARDLPVPAALAPPRRPRARYRRRQPSIPRVAAGRRASRRRVVTRNAGRTLAVSLALIGWPAICATRLDGSRIEYDMSKLRNRESRRTGEGYWGPQMDALLGRNFTAVAFMTDSAAQARVVGAALAEAVRRIRSRRSARGWYPRRPGPPDDAAKRAELARVARLLTPVCGPRVGRRSSLPRQAPRRRGRRPEYAAELPDLLARGMRERTAASGGRC